MYQRDDLFIRERVADLQASATGSTHDPRPEGHRSSTAPGGPSAVASSPSVRRSPARPRSSPTARRTSDPPATRRWPTDGHACRTALAAFSYPGGPGTIRPTLTDIAQAAEANGFASLWVMDHLFQLPEHTGWGGPTEPMLEAYTTLGFLARATDRIAIGPMVGAVHSRHPGLLVKAATTLDVLAGGRTYLALGAGWYEREAKGLGIPFLPAPSVSSSSRRPSGSPA